MAKIARVAKHTEKEELIFFNTHPYNTNMPLHVESCGISHPDPDYKMERMRTEDKLFGVCVFEYVFEGKGYIECKGKTYEVSAGDSYLLGDEASHLYYADKDEPFGKIWINVRGNFIRSLVSDFGCKRDVVISHTDTSHIFEKIRNGYLSNTDYDKMNDLVAVCATEFVIAVSKNARKSNDCLEERIKAVIDNGLHFDITVADLAERFHISQHHLISIFRNKYEVTPKQYILQKKVWAAKNLLAKESCDMNSVAEILGFSSVYHFSSTFKKLTGETPGSYRAKHAHNDKKTN